MRLFLVLMVGVFAGCAEGDTTSSPTEDTDVRPITDVGHNNSVDAGDSDGSACTPAAEVCDGVDNDCDDVIDEDCACKAGETQPCNDSGVDFVEQGACAFGQQACVDGAWGECVGTVAPDIESCNGVDDDCDGDIDEELGEETCGVGACEVTINVCVNGQEVACEPGTPNPTEACDGVDDNCDGDVDEGCECLPNQTQPCYSGSMATRGVGLCADGVQTCDSLGQWGACIGEVLPTAELCDGMDNDCDGVDDNGNPGGGTTCNTGLTGVCAIGDLTCQGAALVCVQRNMPSPDLCDGLDNDCNAATADGSAEATLGTMCDGPDTDLCLEGNIVCQNGSLQCNDTTSSLIDVCNGMDDDCDPTSVDGSEDPGIGQACNGPDTDLCNEGVRVCLGGALSCNDTTGNAIELCDGIDNDCDPATADGSAEPTLGAACDGTDLDVCLEGTITCSTGALACSDTTSSTVEACNGLDDDCDGTIDNGFNRNDNPSCSATYFDIGGVSGDSGSDTLSDSWYNEEWLRFMVYEDSLSSLYLSATISLTSAPGTDYDLYVYCESCGGSLAGSSTTTGLDTVRVRRNDSFASGDNFAVLVEVRHKSSTVCGYWTLNIAGNTTVSSETCP
ncbi:MAG: MopE-related protein [bacterium]